MNADEVYYRTGAPSAYDYPLCCEHVCDDPDRPGWRIVRVLDQERFDACQLPRYSSGWYTAEVCGEPVLLDGAAGEESWVCTFAAGPDGAPYARVVRRRGEPSPPLSALPADVREALGLPADPYAPPRVTLGGGTWDGLMSLPLAWQGPERRGHRTAEITLTSPTDPRPWVSVVEHNVFRAAFNKRGEK